MTDWRDGDEGSSTAAWRVGNAVSLTETFHKQEVLNLHDADQLDVEQVPKTMKSQWECLRIVNSEDEKETGL